MFTTLSPLWSVSFGSSWVSQSGRRSTIPPCARWQSNREYHQSSCSVVLIFSGIFQGCLKTGYLASFSCVPLLVASFLLEDRSDSEMMLWPVPKTVQPVWNLERTSPRAWLLVPTIQCSVERLNVEAKNNERSHEDKKCHHEQRLIDSETALYCNHPGCSFLALTKVGLTNHQCQCHSIIPRIQCQYCLHTFNQQGLYNHNRFCSARPRPST